MLAVLRAKCYYGDSHSSFLKDCRVMEQKHEMISLSGIYWLQQLWKTERMCWEGRIHLLPAFRCHGEHKPMGWQRDQRAALSGITAELQTHDICLRSSSGFKLAVSAPRSGKTRQPLCLGVMNSTLQHARSLGTGWAEHRTGRDTSGHACISTLSPGQLLYQEPHIPTLRASLTSARWSGISMALSYWLDKPTATICAQPVKAGYRGNVVSVLWGFIFYFFRRCQLTLSFSNKGGVMNSYSH